MQILAWQISKSRPLCDFEKSSICLTILQRAILPVAFAFHRFPLFYREERVMGKHVHSQPTVLPGPTAALHSRKVFFLSTIAIKVYVLKYDMNRRAFPTYEVNDTKFCPSVGAVM